MNGRIVATHGVCAVSVVDWSCRWSGTIGTFVPYTGVAALLPSPLRGRGVPRGRAHTPLRNALHDLQAARSSNPLREARAHALALVPAGFPVSATNEFGGYLSDRSLLYTFPHIGRARWAIVDSGDPAHTSYDYGAIGRMRAAHGWQVVYASQGVEVLQKPRDP